MTVTIAPETLPAVNVDGEHRNEVQIHLVTNDDGVTIAVSALVTSVEYGEILDRTPGRELLTLATETTGSPDTDTTETSANLDAMIDTLGITPRIESLIRTLVAEGLKMIDAVE